MSLTRAPGAITRLSYPGIFSRLFLRTDRFYCIQKLKFSCSELSSSLGSSAWRQIGHWSTALVSGQRGRGPGFKSRPRLSQISFYSLFILLYKFECLLRGSPSLVNGARLRTSSLRGSWVQIPPPAFNPRSESLVLLKGKIPSNDVKAGTQEVK